MYLDSTPIFCHQLSASITAHQDLLLLDIAFARRPPDRGPYFFLASQSVAQKDRATKSRMVTAETVLRENICRTDASKKGDIRRLLRWFIENGGSIHPSVLFRLDDAGGIYAYAKEDIPEPPPGGIQLCVCPPKLQLSYHRIPPELREILPEQVCANLALIQEWNLRDSSLWAPYIHCLPRPEQMTTPMYFDDRNGGDTVWLRGTNLNAAWREREVQWANEYTRCRTALDHVGLDFGRFSL